MLTSRLGSFGGLAVLDVFAGTGALGLEALSRGAAEAWFIETDRSARGALETNIARLGASARCRVLPQSAEHPGPAPRGFDLVFLDPPYGKALATRSLAALLAADWLSPGAWISVETGRDESIDVPSLVPDATRAVGKAALHLFRR
jgi:16S rRNA (guanine966-N2)-methyltransferase